MGSRMIEEKENLSRWRIAIPVMTRFELERRSVDGDEHDGLPRGGSVELEADVVGPGEWSVETTG